MKSLEILIGLFFVYLVLSTLVTAVSEILISHWHMRAKILRQSVRRMLFENRELEEAFFNTAEIKSLIDPKRLKKLEDGSGSIDSASPSYLEGETFARNLIKVLGFRNGSILTLDGFDFAIGKWCDDQSALGETSQRRQLAEVLTARIEQAFALQKKSPELDDRESLIQSIKEWYDDSMERSRGIYRRWTRKYVVISALFITFFLNADTVRIVRALSVDDVSRQILLTEATEQLASGQKGVKQLKNLSEVAAQFEDAAADLEDAGIPIGWDRYELEKITESGFPACFAFLLLKALGLLATAIAATLGAPFWYDILNKLSNLRSSAGLKSKDSSATVTTADGQVVTVGTGTPALPVKPARSLKLSFADGEESFDIDRAYWLGRCSLASYLPFAEIESTIPEWGLRDQVTTIGSEAQSTQGFIACNSDCMVIAFRGSEKKANDILVDIDLGQEEWEFESDSEKLSLSVHTGFLKGYNTVQAQVLETVKTYLKQNPQRSIWITGHSLGGALATICLADLITRKIPVSGLYTYGCPRVGDSRFVDYLNQSSKEQIFRFVNQDDPVTEVPLEVIQGYCHVGNLRYFDKRNRLREDSATWKRVLRKTAFWLDLGYDADSKKKAIGMLKQEFQQRGSFHSMVNYMENIQAHSGHQNINT